MWAVKYTKKFLKEMNALPQEVQSRIETIVFQELECQNPFELGYLSKMKGYTDKYKIRIGDYRIGITVDKKQQVIICQRVGHRREIYREFP